MTTTTPPRITRADVDALFRHLVQTEQTLFRLIGRDPVTLERALRLLREAASAGRLSQLLPTAASIPAHESAVITALEGLAAGSDPSRIRAACRAMGHARVTRKALVALASGPLSPQLHRAVDTTFRVRNQLLEMNQGLVGRQVDALLKLGKAGSCESLRSEAMQEASLSLQSSIDRFQPSLDYAFSTFAAPGVAGAIREAMTSLRGNIRLSEGDRRKLKAILATEARLLQEWQRKPELWEIAQALGMPLADAEAVRRGAQEEARFDISSDEAEEDCVGLPKEPVSDDSEASWTASMACSDRDRTLYQALEVLSPKQAQVLRLRFGLGGRDGLSRPEIASELGLPMAKVARLETLGLERMQRSLGEGMRREACLV